MADRRNPGPIRHSRINPDAFGMRVDPYFDRLAAKSSSAIAPTFR
jgi:hypothetical protein